MDHTIDLLPIETATKLSETTQSTISKASRPTSAPSEVGSWDCSASEIPQTVSNCSLSESHGSARDSSDELPKDSQVFTILEQIPSSVSSESVNKRLRWHIYWKQPASMIGSGLFGVLLALVHHIYYSKLHGTLASTSENQEWPIRIGTAFSVFTVTFFGVAITEAYTQYIWSVVRLQTTSLRGLDARFSATKNPFAFFSLEFNSTSAWLPLVALIFWGVKIASIAPPATLSIVGAIQEHSIAAHIPTLNWTKFVRAPPWDVNFIHTSPEILRRASLSAGGFSILPTHAPSVNASYEVNFLGPTLECRKANTTQQQLFDLWTRSFWHSRHVFTPATYSKFISQNSDASRFSPQQLIFSAFTWDYGGLASEYRYNSDPEPAPAACDIPPDYPRQQPLQIWVQTSSSEIVCTLMNSSFKVSFQFNNGLQITTLNSLTSHNPVFLPTYIPNGCREKDPPCIDLLDVKKGYAAVFGALHNILNGNVTLLADRTHLWEISSRVLHTGLIGCDEIQHSGWESYSALQVLDIKEAIGGESWMCRNKSLSRAIEDLSNNITISMLSNPDFLMPNPDLINVTTYTYENEYFYSPEHLLQSYGIAMVFTVMAIALGLLSLRSNGVSHSTSFSAIMSTTRNLQLDELVIGEGQDIGSEPLPEAMMKARLKFGKLLDRIGSADGDVKHIGFGYESQAQTLRRGEVI